MIFRNLRFTFFITAMFAVLLTGSSGSAVLAQDDATLAVESGVITDPSDELLASLADCTDVSALAAGEAIPIPDGAVAYTIDSENSEARYEAEEELVGIGANKAIGRTNAFIGQIFLDADGLPIACSRFDVDMRTLVSDESRRDNFLYNNTLESETYPVATFVVRGVEGYEEPLANGEETTIYLIGDLTLHGVTQLAVWEATITVDDDGVLTGAAGTEFDMAEFNITPPTVGPVVGISDPIRLAVDIVAQPTGA